MKQHTVAGWQALNAFCTYGKRLASPARQLVYLSANGFREVIMYQSGETLQVETASIRGGLLLLFVISLKVNQRAMRDLDCF